MSNLNISGLSEIGYSLPEGCSWETTSFVNGKKDGIFTVLDNEGIRIAKLEYHNDKLNGECVFYESGRPKQRITYVNNIQMVGYAISQEEIKQNGFCIMIMVK